MLRETQEAEFSRRSGEYYADRPFFVDVPHFVINRYERRQVSDAAIRNHTMYFSSIRPRIPHLEAATDALDVAAKRAVRH